MSSFWGRRNGAERACLYCGLYGVVLPGGDFSVLPVHERPGTKKRCSRNLQSCLVKTWKAVFTTINIFDRHGDQLISNSFRNL